MRYASTYERLVANTRLAVPGNPQSCWLWTGGTSRGYPYMTQRIDGKPQGRRAHRVMLEEVLDAEFPLDDAGHLCYTTRCINPAHLEVQTIAANLSERRGYAACAGSWIPVLFPREDALQAAADRAWDTPGEVSRVCPF